jgi:hypothetical protein
MPLAPRALFAGLVDDAALFPPGNAAMDVGLRDHAAHLASPYGDLIGPFLCPVTRIDELTAALDEAGHLDVSLVVDATGEPTHHALRSTGSDQRLTLVGIEAAYSRLGDDAAGVGRNLLRLPGTAGFLEVPRTAFEAALALAGTSGWQAAKYRSGGTTAEAFPSGSELAAFLVACAKRSLPFKLTAGLHHAVRNTDAETGFEQHGVVNVLMATRAALAGQDVNSVMEVLEERNTDALCAAVAKWSEDDALAERRAFRSFGCCGVTDPINELGAVGLLEGEAP